MTELGTRAGLSQQSISYVERGKRYPNAETLLRIAFALDINLSELIIDAEILAGVRRGTSSELPKER